MSPGRLQDNRKRRVVALGNPKYIGKDYLDGFAEQYDFSVLEAYDRKSTQELLPKDIEQNGSIDAFIIRMGTPPYEPFDENLLKALAPDCKIITSASAGYNEFDVDWMTSRGIYFCNTVDAVAEATADMAMFLTLATLRNTSAAEKSAKSGKWRNGLVPVRDPTGLTLGIVGMGAIGKYLAKKAAVFNMEIKYFNRRRLSPEIEAKCNATYCSTLHDLLACSDVVSLSCPLNAETTGLIGKKEFAAMRDGTFLVNTARGAVIDEAVSQTERLLPVDNHADIAKAFKEALDSGKIERAGLDVFCNEPNVDPYFLNHERIIVQPHMGGLTDAAFRKAERECFENIKAYFTTGKPNSPVRELSQSK